RRTAGSWPVPPAPRPPGSRGRADRRVAAEARPLDEPRDVDLEAVRARTRRAESVPAPVGRPASADAAPVDGGGVADDAVARRADGQPRRRIRGGAGGRD